MPSKEKQRNIDQAAEDARLRALCPHAVAYDNEPDPWLDEQCAALTGIEETAMHLAEGTYIEEKVIAYFARYREAFADLFHCPRFVRLRGLKQFGCKRYPAEPDTTDWTLIVTMPSVHDRATHSQQVAAHNIVAGLFLGLTWEEITILAFGALLHDLGHAVYGHDSEPFLLAQGRLPHEERGQEMVRHDTDIHESMMLAGLGPEHIDAIIMVMQEKGKLGKLQKIMDTLAYIQLDAAMIGTTLPERFAIRLISALREVTEHDLHVRSPEPFQDLLQMRAELGRLAYYCRSSRIIAGALEMVLRYVVGCGHVTLEDIEEGTDGEMERFMAGLVNDPGVRFSSIVRSAWSIAHGCFDELSMWDEYLLNDVEGVRALLSARGKAGLYGIVCPPYNYTGKTLSVCLRNGARKTLQATLRPDPLDSQWIVLLPKI